MMITAQLCQLEEFAAHDYPHCFEDLKDSLESSMNTLNSPTPVRNRNSDIRDPSCSGNSNCPKQRSSIENIRIELSRATCQICKALVAAHRGPPSFTSAASVSPSAAAVRPELVEHCARNALRAILSISGSRDGSELALCEALLRAEEMPQVARWHRKDLVPAALAAWRSALQALARARERRADAGAGGRSVREPTTGGVGGEE